MIQAYYYWPFERCCMCRELVCPPMYDYIDDNPICSKACKEKYEAFQRIAVANRRALYARQKPKSYAPWCF